MVEKDPYEVFRENGERFARSVNTERRARELQRAERLNLIWFAERKLFEARCDRVLAMNVIRRTKKIKV